MLSIVVPTLNEGTTIGALLGDLCALTVPHEVIVADGGSTDETTQAAALAGARVIHAARGRGAQLAAGAQAAHGMWLAFLHSDVRIGAAARLELERVVRTGTPPHVYVFSLRIAASGVGYRLVEWGADRRTRWARLPYGDQGLIVARETYDRVGGYDASLPIMEDVELMRRLRRTAPLEVLGAPLTVSARRWARIGLVRGTLRNWTLLSAYLLGVHPNRLARAYAPPRVPLDGGVDVMLGVEEHDATSSSPRVVERDGKRV